MKINFFNWKTFQNNYIKCALRLMKTSLMDEEKISAEARAKL